MCYHGGTVETATNSGANVSLPTTDILKTGNDRWTYGRGIQHVDKI